MRLALRGANPAEWLALRAGLVPAAAADAWGGMALSGVAVAAVRPLAVLDAFAEPDRRASAHADMLALFVYLSSGGPGARAAWVLRLAARRGLRPAEEDQDPPHPQPVAAGRDQVRVGVMPDGIG